ncbi:hypothetical protein DAEQUDRAFT_526710 [Daedalea quercina L-15889]|uniref:Uncharacterized protein n=1 Tax=Daedalea quercina L-15889 TaxID=1314783 RepID=A0A165M9L2_9APHY|nr:hypothetical protein DAEQUDRAFT_526710 [Daedalea quercina L-15889]
MSRKLKDCLSSYATVFIPVGMVHGAFCASGFATYAHIMDDHLCIRRDLGGHESSVLHLNSYEGLRLPNPYIGALLVHDQVD